MLGLQHTNNQLADAAVTNPRERVQVGPQDRKHIVKSVHCLINANMVQMALGVNNIPEVLWVLLC